ncbi:NADP-dependent oxidoreductase [Klenkia marina]|uniref:NADP-dependent oxidoreductase n=1 Tax=Klenkia marina TaxID=1960309 RepID=UPI001FB24DF3|nr:NADP-dependent oxidoreductase [Klenkia marina]
MTEFGGPEALHLLDVPEVHAGEGEVRLAVRAAAVNPTDTYARNGTYAQHPKAPKEMPWIPGMDVAGVVDEVGPATDTPLQVGDRVMAIVVPSGAHGGYREQIVLPAASVVPVPAGVSDAEAASLPMNGLTARLALDRMGLAPGQVLAVTGAAGAFGGYVVQLAKVDGLVVVADASEADRELVRSFGADVVLERGAGWADAVLDRYPGGVDGLADGALLGAEGARVVRDGGVVTTVRGYRGEDDALARGVRFEPVFVRDYGQNTAALDLLRQQAERGEVTLRVADEVPVADAAAAHARLEAGGVRGRLVLVF